ncbi:MAG: dihydroneopterin aldolase family protein [Candidatus Hydrothermarchaeales archaeon]
MVLDKASTVSGRERSIFECGIKLATVYPQFIGTPISKKSRKSLEDVNVKISLGKTNKYGYIALSGEMLNVAVTTRVNTAKCKCRMKYINDDYPLMYVEEVEEVRG